MDVRLIDVAVFLAAMTGPMALMWVLSSIGGRGINIGLTALPFLAAFGFGVAVIVRAMGLI